eukprot:1158815-Pelagomonas_calceolata.AAC.2
MPAAAVAADAAAGAVCGEPQWHTGQARGGSQSAGCPTREPDVDVCQSLTCDGSGHAAREAQTKVALDTAEPLLRALVDNEVEA